MAKATLPINFKDDILNSSMGGKRRYNLIQNSDGTVSLEDVTTYTRMGSDFGAAQMNQTNQAVNQSCDKANVIETMDNIIANQASGMIAGAKAVKELNNKIPEEGNGYLRFADGTLIQWGRAYFQSTASGGGGSVKVNFSVPFTSKPKMSVTPIYASSADPTFTVSAQSYTNTANLYARTRGGAVVSSCYADWMAIGR